MMRALLIGIDRYEPNPWCDDLRGAVADVEAMCAYLLSIGVGEDRIRLLVSPGVEHRTESVGERPTWSGIVGAILASGEEAARTGEALLIHYSGHGGRAKTWLPAAKGTTGFDEGLLPCDLATTGGRMLRDVELTWLLDTLVRRGVRTILLIDACHGGGLLRSGRGAVRCRGARRPLGLDSLGLDGVDECLPPVAPIEELDRVWRRVHDRRLDRLPRPSTTWRQGRSRSGWISPRLARSAGVLVLAACRGTDWAWERDFGSGPRGALSWHLLEALRGRGGGWTWESLYRHLAHRLLRLSPPQRPVFEGIGEAGDGRISTELLRGPTVDPSASVGRSGGVGPWIARRPSITEKGGRTTRPAPPGAFDALRALAARRQGHGGLELRLTLLPEGHRPGGCLDAAAELPAHGPSIAVGRWILCELLNRGPRTLFVSLLDLCPDGSVEQLHPRRGCDLLEPAERLRLPFELFLPPGQGGGTETLVAIGTHEPSSFEALRRGPLASSAISGMPMQAPEASTECWSLAEGCMAAVVDFRVVR